MAEEEGEDGSACLKGGLEANKPPFGPQQADDSEKCLFLSKYALLLLLILLFDL